MVYIIFLKSAKIGENSWPIVEKLVCNVPGRQSGFLPEDHVQAVFAGHHAGKYGNLRINRLFCTTTSNNEDY
jgi:hypothetical protein